MSWKCPACNKYNEDNSPKCGCGYGVDPVLIEHAYKSVETRSRYRDSRRREEFIVDRRGLGLLFRASKLESRCEEFITSRIVKSEKNGFNVSDSLFGIDPWHTYQGSPLKRLDRLVIDTSSQLVKVFDVVKEKVTESTFAIADIAEVVVEVEPKGMIEYSSSLGKLVLAGALVGGVAGVLTALVLDDVLSLFKSAKVVNFLFRVRFGLLSGGDVSFEFLKKEGYVIQRESDYSGSHFREFLSTIVEAEDRCLDFLNRHFSTRLSINR